MITKERFKYDVGFEYFSADIGDMKVTFCVDKGYKSLESELRHSCFIIEIDGCVMLNDNVSTMEDDYMHIINVAIDKVIDEYYIWFWFLI